MGSALYSLGQLEEAAEAYEKGLQYDPNNTQMKESLEDVRKQLFPGTGYPGAPGFGNLFNSPNLFAKLQADPRTKPFLSDPAYMQILKNLQNNPKSIQ